MTKRPDSRNHTRPRKSKPQPNKQPAGNVSESRLREWRRLFYVGFTRAEKELHIVHTNGRPSHFVLEVQHRLETGE